MTPEEWHWLVGLWEGEGCFDTTSPRPQGRKYPRATLKMTDVDVVKRAADLLGWNVRGPIRPASHKSYWKDAWTISETGYTAREFMQAALPFLGERRSQRVAEVLTTWYGG